jgi:hypothetical protein
MVFRNNEIGRFVSDGWKYWLLNVNNPFYEKYGSCGDQGYLHAFFEITDPNNICVFDVDGPVSHLAPWCTWMDGKPICFFHFSHFNFDLANNTWRDSLRGEWRPARHEHIMPYYENYFKVIKKMNNLVK